MAATVVDLLDRLGLEQVDVLGVSLGGAVAQQLARSAPHRVRRLVLAATAPGVGGLPVSLTVAALVAFPFGVGGASNVIERPALLLGAASVALLQTIFPYVLELLALRRIPTRVFGVLASLNPAAAAIAGLVVLHQRLGPVQLAALALVTLASAGVTLVRDSTGRPAPSPASHRSRESPASGPGAWPRCCRRRS